MKSVISSTAVTILLLLGSVGFAQEAATEVEPAAQEAPSEVGDSDNTKSEAPSNESDESSSETTKTEPVPGKEALDELQKKLAEKGKEGSEEKDDTYELLMMFADALDQVERNYVEPISRRELMEAAIKGVVSKLDQYSNFIAPEDLDRFKTGVENEFGGIGIRVVEDRRGGLRIISPIVGSPAYEAGIRPGDRVVEVNNQSIRGKTVSEAISMMKGKAGTTVDVKIVRLRGKVEEFTLERRRVQVSTVMGINRNEDDTWNFVLDQDKKIGYVRVSAFSRHTSGELSEALRTLDGQGVNGLIVDLRFNPGGLLSSAVEVSDLFLNSGTIVSTEGRNVVSQSWEAKKAGTFENFKMVILVNRYSASASEIVAAALQDHERAIVIGNRTWGKGSVQNIVELDGGRSAMKITTASYARPSGVSIHRFKGAEKWGVDPSEGFEVSLNDRDIQRLLNFQETVNIASGLNKGDDDGEEKPFERTDVYVDPQLKKAVEYLEQQVAVADVDTK